MSILRIALITFILATPASACFKDFFHKLWKGNVVGEWPKAPYISDAKHQGSIIPLRPGITGVKLVTDLVKLRLVYESISRISFEHPSGWRISFIKDVNAITHVDFTDKRDFSGESRFWLARNLPLADYFDEKYISEEDVNE